MNRRLTPAVMWVGYGLTAVWAVALRVVMDHPGSGRHPLLLRPFAFAPVLIAANAITLWLALKIGAEYPADRPIARRMRTAWLLIAAGAACEIPRYAMLYLAGWRFGGSGGPVGWPGPASQMANLAALGLLLAGLVGMRSSFAQLGLGRLRNIDKALAASVVVSVPLLFVLRRSAPDINRAPLITIFQSLDPLLLGACAIAAICLNRTRRDMEGGLLDVSLRYMVALALLRLITLLVGSIAGANAWIIAPFTAATLGSDWLLALVVYYRWQLTSEAGALADRYVTK